MTSCGIDIIEIKRIEKAIVDNPNFLNRVFTDEELLYYTQNNKRVQSLAGFFAAKEAFSKYMGTGILKFSLKDISVGHNGLGAPYISFKGVRQEVSLSISHNDTTATAMVCGSGQVDYKDSVMDEMREIIPKHSETVNKGDCGKVLVIAGSQGMTGAAVLSAYSALRAGAGLVTLATAESERSIAASFYPEIMTKGLPSKDGAICENAMGEILTLAKGKDAIVFGPGLGQSRDIMLLLAELLKTYTGKLVIDADGLNALSGNIDILKERACCVVLTPHPGEMSRLTKKAIEDIQKDRVSTARNFAQEHNICLVLKGHNTVVSAPQMTEYLNTTGNCGMATAGTGDVLSGIIAAFLAQGMDSFSAARLGVYVHGLAGDIARTDKGTHGLIATDVIEAIPYAISKILK